MEAYRLAVEQGADWVEMDVRQTRDGVLVLHHDAHLDEPHSPAIAELSSDDLPDYVPSLVEGLEVCDGVGVAVEIKNDPNEPGYDSTNQISLAVAGILQAYARRQIVISFNLASLNHIKAEDAELATGLLVYDAMAAAQSVAAIAELGHLELWLYSPIITAGLVEQAHAQGIKVQAWTINEAEQMHQLLDWGVDGIVTDFPELAMQVREERG